MHKYLFVFLFAFLFSCLSPEEIDFSSDPLVVKLDQRLKTLFLEQKQYQIKKTVSLEEHEESKTIAFDTLILKKDLKALGEYTFSRLINKASYAKTNEENGWVFRRRNGEKKGPEWVRIKQTGDLISSLAMKFTEENMLYVSRKEIELTFDNGRLSGYKIVGERKLIGMGPSTFTLKASIDKL